MQYDMCYLEILLYNIFPIWNFYYTKCIIFVPILKIPFYNICSHLEMLLCNIYSYFGNYDIYNLFPLENSITGI